MIETTLPLTLSLATAFGVYMIVAGLSGLRDGDRYAAILDEFLNRDGLTYVTGVFVFCLGVAIILVHNVWTDPLAGLISLVGWAAALEGLVLIAAPAALLGGSRKLLGTFNVKVFSGVVVALGCLITLAGVTGTAGAS